MRPDKNAPEVPVYYELPGYPRPVFARLGKSFEVSVYAVWGAVFVTIPPEMNATAAVDLGLELADSVAADQAKFRDALASGENDAPP